MLGKSSGGGSAAFVRLGGKYGAKEEENTFGKISEQKGDMVDKTGGFHADFILRI